jgi:MFS family permease
MRSQIGTLILATSLVQFANGFFGTFISLRVVNEAFDPGMAGLVLSSYFAGFAVAATRSGEMIGRIGHIRAYAAFAGLVVCGTAVMPLLVDPVAWIVLRAVIGFGCAGLFVATESWLNAKAAPSERGRVFSVYMVGTFLALALGQVLIGRIDIASEAPFSAIVVLFALALVMVSAMRAEPPAIVATARLPYGTLTRAAPVAVFGSALSGIITSAFYTLVPAWMQDRGIGQQTIALLMLVAVLGGFAFQIPVGRLSDRFDRRVVLASIAAGTAASAGVLLAAPRVLAVVLPFAALLGGFMSTLYPVCVAHAHDRMPQDRVVAVSGRMILISGVGSVIGPLAGSVLKPALGINGVLLLIAGAAVLIALLAAGRGVVKMAPRQLRRPFALLTPQATPLAHDAYDQDAVAERQAA